MPDRIAERSNLIDLLLALALTGFALFGVRQWPLDGAPDAALVRDLLVVVLCLSLARRRREPRLVLVIVTLAAAAIWIGGFADGPTAVAGSVAFYGAGRYVERPASLQIVQQSRILRLRVTTFRTRRPHRGQGEPRTLRGRRGRRHC